jgi:hypothetical protein
LGAAVALPAPLPVHLAVRFADLLRHDTLQGFDSGHPPGHKCTVPHATVSRGPVWAKDERGRRQGIIAKRFSRELQAVAHRIAERHWVVIDYIAHELLSNRTISHWEFRELFCEGLRQKRMMEADVAEILASD